MHEKNRQLNVTKDPRNLLASQKQLLSLLAKLKNFNSIKIQYQLIHEFFGFDIHTVSRKNLKAMRNCLRKGKDGVTAHQGMFQHPKALDIKVDQNIKNQTQYSV